MSKENTTPEFVQELDAADKAGTLTTLENDDGGTRMIANLGKAQMTFSSFKADTPEKKVSFYNAISNPDKRLRECVNTTINVKDIYVEVVTCANEETGEENRAPRIIFIDDKGLSYQAVSKGILSAVDRIMRTFGHPATWDKPLKIVPKTITKGKNNILTLEVCI